MDGTKVVARTNTRFKTAYNALLARLDTWPEETPLPSEAVIADWLSVSRTVARSVLRELDEAKIVDWRGRRKDLLRRPLPSDRFSLTELRSGSEKVERAFLEWILRRDVPPDTRLNVRDLSRRFSVSPSSVTEFLSGFSRFGLVRREGRDGWMLDGFTPQYAMELSDFRQMIEIDAALRFAALGGEHPVWAELEAMEREHHRILDEIEVSFHDFSALDDRFHATIVAQSQNRFALEFQNLISFVFHYHYQWNKRFERQRNEAAIGEHLAYIAALRSQEPARIEIAARAHLATARQTLLASIERPQV
ncbi:GntR family transcriptional regulator [Jiella mangrovi]|uniref:GntR family transcriptional regulator n=1 Tax=Jiella mangrovi TaxID=2821407 RepID=A0ABS4BJJ0_9HYPH|nr:GntR family transcriptional regulator [Jiella mangrovi]MBP0616935.1 GntR family transcriptional regulator [Jiella mangrovi]